MIALTGGCCKGVQKQGEPPGMRPRDRKHRFTGSLAESYCCPTSANRAPRWVATRRYCVGPVLSVPDSSAPSPPGPSGSGLFAEGVQSRYWANESWSIFVCGAGFVCGPGFADRSGSSATRRNQPRANARRNDIHSENFRQKNSGKRFSAARSLPRRASRPAFRGCRPGHRPPRHRRPRGRYSPAEWSSFPRRRSSRRPSRDCARRCSR